MTTTTASTWPATVQTVVYDGGKDSVIGGETDPFLATLDGIPVDLLAIEKAGRFIPAASGCEDCDGGLLAGAVAPINTDFGIEVCGTCAGFRLDFDAAEAVAAHLIAQGLVKGPLNVRYVPDSTDPRFSPATRA